MTQTWGTATSMWLGMLATCMEGRELESREGECREVVGWAARLSDPRQALVLAPGRKVSATYAGAEVLWYMSGAAGISAIEPYAPQYPKWAEDDGTMWGGWGWRMADFSPGFRRENKASRDRFTGQLHAAIELLRAKPNTRQAVIALWDGGDIVHAVDGDRANLPCATSLQLLARDGQLHAVATIRSNDAWLGAPYDIFALTSVQCLVAAELGLRPGAYTHQVGSLHLYEKYRARAVRVLNDPDLRASVQPAHDHEAEDAWRSRPDAPAARGRLVESAAYYAHLEAAGRAAFSADTAEMNALALEERTPRSLLRDCLMLAWSASIPGFDAELFIAAPRLRESLRRQIERRKNHEAKRQQRQPEQEAAEADGLDHA